MVKTTQARALLLIVISSIIWSVQSRTTEHIACTTNCECARNVHNHLSATCSSVDELTGLPSNLEILHVKDFPSGVLENNQFALLGTWELKTLQLSHANIYDMKPKSFYGLEHLKIINLEYNQLSTIPSQIFQNNPHLRNLKLRGNPLSPPSNNTIFIPSALSLEELDLSLCNLKHIPVTYLAHLVHLERLDLSGNQLETLDEDLFRTFKKLQFLDISSNQLQTLKPNHFFEIKLLKHIHMINNLWICNCELLATRNFLLQHNITTIEPVVCSEPIKYFGRPWKTIHKDRCHNTKQEEDDMETSEHEETTKKTSSGEESTSTETSQIRQGSSSQHHKRTQHHQHKSHHKSKKKHESSKKNSKTVEEREQSVKQIRPSKKTELKKATKHHKHGNKQRHVLEDQFPNQNVIQPEPILTGPEISLNLLNVGEGKEHVIIKRSVFDDEDYDGSGSGDFGSGDLFVPQHDLKSFFEKSFYFDETSKSESSSSTTNKGGIILHYPDSNRPDSEYEDNLDLKNSSDSKNKTTMLIIKHADIRKPDLQDEEDVKDETVADENNPERAISYTILGLILALFVIILGTAYWRGRRKDNNKKYDPEEEKDLKDVEQPLLNPKFQPDKDICSYDSEKPGDVPVIKVSETSKAPKLENFPETKPEKDDNSTNILPNGDGNQLKDSLNDITEDANSLEVNPDETPDSEREELEIPRKETGSEEKVGQRPESKNSDEDSLKNDVSFPQKDESTLQNSSPTPAANLDLKSEPLQSEDEIPDDPRSFEERTKSLEFIDSPELSKESDSKDDDVFVDNPENNQPSVSDPYETSVMNRLPSSDSSLSDILETPQEINPVENSASDEHMKEPNSAQETLQSSHPEDKEEVENVRNSVENSDNGEDESKDPEKAQQNTDWPIPEEIFSPFDEQMRKENHKNLIDEEEDKPLLSTFKPELSRFDFEAPSDQTDSVGSNQSDNMPRTPPPTPAESSCPSLQTEEATPEKRDSLELPQIFSPGTYTLTLPRNKKGDRKSVPEFPDIHYLNNETDKAELSPKSPNRPFSFDPTRKPVIVEMYPKIEPRPLNSIKKPDMEGSVGSIPTDSTSTVYYSAPNMFDTNMSLVDIPIDDVPDNKRTEKTDDVLSPDAIKSSESLYDTPPLSPVIGKKLELMNGHTNEPSENGHPIELENSEENIDANMHDIPSDSLKQDSPQHLTSKTPLNEPAFTSPSKTFHSQLPKPVPREDVIKAARSPGAITRKRLNSPKDPPPSPPTRTDSIKNANQTRNSEMQPGENSNTIPSVHSKPNSQIPKPKSLNSTKLTPRGLNSPILGQRRPNIPLRTETSRLLASAAEGNTLTSSSPFKTQLPLAKQNTPVSNLEGKSNIPIKSQPEQTEPLTNGDVVAPTENHSVSNGVVAHGNHAVNGVIDNDRKRDSGAYRRYDNVDTVVFTKDLL